MTEDLKNKVEKALVRSLSARTAREFPDAQIVPSTYHYEQQAKELMIGFESLIKELTEREEKLVELLENSKTLAEDSIDRCIQDIQYTNGRRNYPLDSRDEDVVAALEKVKTSIKELNIE